MIPNQASHYDEHPCNRPGGDASDKNEEQKLSDIIPACFSAEEFAAYFPERAQFLGRKNGRGTRLGVASRLKGVIR
jgi:hypothetical protein